MPSGLVDLYQCFRGTDCRHVQGQIVIRASKQNKYSSAYSSSLKMEAVQSSEMSVIYGAARRHIQEDRTLRNLQNYYRKV
jgi:hypothetical protein